MRYVLSSDGYKVLEATDLEQAAIICSARMESLDLAILETAAEPGLTWPRSHPCTPLLTILPEFQAQYPSDDFWQLPFDPDQLLSQVRSALAEGKGVSSGEMQAILMVEDNELLRHAVATMLRRHGFFVFEAEDGSSAISLFEANQTKIGLALLDINLPGESGEKVFERLEEIRPGVKVILTSADTQDILEGAMGGRKPWVFVRKPYRVCDLLRVIRTAHTGTVSQ
jgi:CheY-like chemotaxis protein